MLEQQAQEVQEVQEVHQALAGVQVQKVQVQLMRLLIGHWHRLAKTLRTRPNLNPTGRILTAVRRGRVADGTTMSNGVCGFDPIFGVSHILHCRTMRLKNGEKITLHTTLHTP